MRRRQHHSRSRNGCFTCKARHVRCDERLPYCGNCLRVGRECIYTANTSGDSSDSAPDTPPIPEASMMSSLPPAAHQAWLARNRPQGHAVFFLPPHYRDLDPDTISILQRSHEILGERPMPRSCLLTIQKDYAPRYTQLAAQYDCVKFAHISFAAYTHHQETKSPVSKEICIRYTCDALRELQKEIESFSENNADAIVTASVGLAGTADDWEQWLVFVDGYTRALSHIRDNNLRTVCPELLGENFQLRNFFSRPNTSAQPSPVTRTTMEQRVRSLVNSVVTLRDVLGQPQWRSIGFSDLEQLAWSVDTALSLDSESETYHKLAWLRSWMFWIELRQPNEGDEQKALTFYFYALVLSIVSLFPTRYAESLTNVCVSRMEVILQGMNEEVAGAYGLLNLMSSVQDDMVGSEQGLWEFGSGKGGDCWTVEEVWDEIVGDELSYEEFRLQFVFD